MHLTTLNKKRWEHMAYEQSSKFSLAGGRILLVIDVKL